MEAIVEQLIACLKALDQAKHPVAAAQLTAAIESLIATEQADSPEQN